MLFDLIVGFAIIYFGLLFLGWLVDNGAVIFGWLLALGVLGVTTWVILALTGKPGEMADPTAIGGAAIVALLVLAFAAWPISKVYEFVGRQRKKHATRYSSR